MELDGKRRETKAQVPENKQFEGTVMGGSCQGLASISSTLAVQGLVSSEGCGS